MSPSDLIKLSWMRRTAGFNMLADRKGSCTRSIHASPKASNLLDSDQDLGHHLQRWKVCGGHHLCDHCLIQVVAFQLTHDISCRHAIPRLRIQGSCYRAESLSCPQCRVGLVNFEKSQSSKKFQTVRLKTVVPCPVFFWEIVREPCGFMSNLTHKIPCGK